MEPVEVALLVAVSLVAVGLIAYIVRPYVRARRAVDAEAAGKRTTREMMAPKLPEVVCPACHREYPTGMRYCPYDARELVSSNDPSVRSVTAGLTCPSCRRSFDGTKKYCSFDGEELIPLTRAMAGVAARAAGFGEGPGKICPHCSRRYEGDATFCGRDGSELVSVN